MNNFSPAQWLGQLLAWALFIAFIGYFVSAPPYQHQEPGMATVKLSLVHSGQLVGECRTLSPQEMANPPPNMRAPEVCPRERSPLTLELLVNGEMLVSESIAPKGLHGDGRAALYRRLTLPAGPVELLVRMKDDVRAKDFSYVAQHSAELAPAQVLVIDFDGEHQRFRFF